MGKAFTTGVVIGIRRPTQLGIIFTIHRLVFSTTASLIFSRKAVLPGPSRSRQHHPGNGKLEKGAHVQIEGELRYREYEKNHGTKTNPLPVKHRAAEITSSRVLKLDRAEKEDESTPEFEGET